MSKHFNISKTGNSAADYEELFHHGYMFIAKYILELWAVEDKQNRVLNAWSTLQVLMPFGGFKGMGLLVHQSDSL